MGGLVPFEEALAARLGLFKPSLAHAQDFLKTRPPKYVGDGLMNNLQCMGWMITKGDQHFRLEVCHIVEIENVGSSRAENQGEMAQICICEELCPARFGEELSG